MPCIPHSAACNPIQDQFKGVGYLLFSKLASEKSFLVVHCALINAHITTHLEAMGLNVVAIAEQCLGM